RTVLDGGLDGPALRLNLATIDAQLARRGSAALHLRAAGRMALESGDDEAHRAANAAFRAVRPGAGEAWPPDIMPAPSRFALDAAHAAGVGTLLAAFAACWSLGWLTLAMRLGRFGPHMPWLIPATLLLAGALSGGVLGAASFADARAGSLGVIVTDRATLRAGPGDAFDAVATAAGEGADVRVVREQRGWLRIETAGGAEGWIPRDAVAFVTQP
ncbi:MAG: SH3 domain-containing protein, partial [Phycisphaerales bacterium]